MQVDKFRFKEICVCGYTRGSHMGVLNFETIRDAVNILKSMGPMEIDVETPREYKQCCNNYRRDNLRYLEAIANG